MSKDGLKNIFPQILNKTIKESIFCNNNNNELKNSHSLKLFNFFSEEDENNNSENDNFNKLVEKQKEIQFHDIKEFLKELKMEYYLHKFSKFKIFNNSQIIKLKGIDLLRMNIPIDNHDFILEKIEELKNKIYSNEKNNNNINNNNNNDDNKNELAIQCENNNNIFTLEENEKIQSELFKQAVEEFRKMGNKNKKNEEINVNKSITTNNTDNISVNNNNNPKKFLLEIGESENLNLNKLSLFENKANDVNDDINYIPELCFGKACWNCYKIINNVFSLNFHNKFFCEEKCLIEYKNKNEVLCFFCNKMFIKFEAILFNGKKFCSEICFEKFCKKNKIKK